MPYNPATGRYEPPSSTRTTSPRNDFAAQPGFRQGTFGRPATPSPPQRPADSIAAPVGSYLDRVRGPSGSAVRTPSTSPVRTPATGTGGGGGGGGGSFGGGGGGGGGTSPTLPPTADDRARERLSELEALRAARLEAALAAIGADYDLQEQQMRAQLTGLEDQFVRGILENRRLGEQVVRREENTAAQRGLGNSGIFARALAEGLGTVADQRADIIGALSSEGGLERLAAEGVDLGGEGLEEGTQVRDLLSQIALLAQQEEQARANAELESEQEELSMEEMLALIAAGLR